VEYFDTIFNLFWVSMFKTKASFWRACLFPANQSYFNRFRYSFICQDTSTIRRQRSDLFGLWIKLPLATTSLQHKAQKILECYDRHRAHNIWFKRRRLPV